MKNQKMKSICIVTGKHDENGDLMGHIEKGIVMDGKHRMITTNIIRRSVVALL